VYLLKKKRIILIFVVIFFVLYSFNAASASSGLLKIKAESGTVVAQKHCSGTDYTCVLDYSYCGKKGDYTMWFTADGITIAKKAYYCDCGTGDTQCPDNRYEVCLDGEWQDSGVDLDNDDVDEQCEDLSCDNASGVCETEVEGKCVGRTVTETDCFDFLDNDCDGTVDCLDSDCNGRTDDTRGCWNGNLVLSGDTTQERDDILNLNGAFYGCSIADNATLDLTDPVTGLKVIQNKDYCFTDPNNFWYCSFNNKWDFAKGKKLDHASTVPIEIDPNPEQATGCCIQNECWTGTGCKEDQKNNPNAQPVNGFRCIDGDWIDANLKFDPAGTIGGFCPEQSQCLVDPSGNFDDNNQPDKNPQCIANDQYTDDDYCEDGGWVSRTKFIALKLLELTQGNDYAVFCDNSQTSLNELEYVVNGELAENLISEANNFCVLSIGSKVISGTSLNEPINEGSSEILETLGIEDCNLGLINDGQYHACDGSNKVWYNEELQSLVYSNQPFTLGQNNFQQNFLDFIKNPFDTIVNVIQNSIEEPFDTSYVDGINKFQKLYLEKTGSKTISGSLEGTQFKNLLIEYGNFNTDICTFIDEYDEKNKDGASGIECSGQGNTYTILAQGSDFTNIDPADIWSDLTSKLRIK
tara:strand:- start:28539 stop:30446 length:1908 start_codon:yes stop_codon:yes gene_type:complete